MKTTTKLRLTQAGGILATIAPLATVVGINLDSYITTKTSIFQLTIGGILLVVVIALAFFGKLKKLLGSGFAFCGLIFVFSMLLQPVLNELEVLSGAMLAGQGINVVAFKPLCAKYKAEIEEDTTEEKTKKVLVSAMEQFSGRV
ncbi:MAG: hypothetical protein IJ981_03100 [Clostridia bacterium]|nr:hypothetical protein [Clostridia bacterium]